MDCFDNEGTTMRPSKRRAQKQHATLTRRLRTVMATTASHGDGTATSHGDDDGDVARWRRRRRRRVTATSQGDDDGTSHCDGDGDFARWQWLLGSWEAGATKKWMNYVLETKNSVKEREWTKEMGNGDILCRLRGLTTIISLLKIYIYIHEIYTNSKYNWYKKSFLILQKCHRINFYTGWKYNRHKRSHIIYKIVVCLTWWIWTGIIM